MTLTVKHYKPSDPEFEAIAKTITHVSHVKAISQKRTYIDAEPSGSKKLFRRLENVDKIRG